MPYTPQSNEQKPNNCNVFGKELPIKGDGFLVPLIEWNT